MNKNYQKTIDLLTKLFGRCKDHLDPAEGECLGCMADKICNSLEQID